MKLRKRLIFSVNGMMLGVIIIMGIFLQIVLGSSLFNRTAEMLKSQTADTKKAADLKIQTFIKTAEAYATNAIYTEALTVNDEMTKGMVFNALEQIVTDSNNVIESVVLLGSEGDLRVASSIDRISEKLPDILKETLSGLQEGHSTMQYTFQGKESKYIVMTVPVKEFGLYSGSLVFAIRLDEFFKDFRDDNAVAEIIVLNKAGLVVEHQDAKKVLVTTVENIGFKEHKGLFVFTDSDGTIKFAQKVQLENGWSLYRAVKKSYIYSTLFTVRTILYVSFVFALVLSIAVTGLIAGSIVKPIRNVTESLVNISEGEGDLTQRIEVLSNYDEEIAQLAGAFNKFADQIETIIASVSAASTDIADSTGELNNDSKEIDMMAMKQNETLVMMANDMEQVHAKITEVNDESQIVLDANTVMQNTVTDSMKTVDTMHDQMSTIEESVEKTSNDLNELGTWINAINDMLTLIKDVSDQTNLLALNAAIEAARAGEAGKGFAVVADEVRKLAEKTASSAGEIETIITNIDKKTSEAIKSMHTSLENVGVGRTYVTQTVDALKVLSTTIVQTIGKINTMTTEIQTIGSISQEFFAGIESVSDTANIISGQISGLTQKVDTLTYVAADMSGKINRFTYRVGSDEVRGLTIKE